MPRLPPFFLEQCDVQTDLVTLTAKRAYPPLTIQYFGASEHDESRSHTGHNAASFLVFFLRETRAPASHVLIVALKSFAVAPSRGVVSKSCR